MQRRGTLAEPSRRHGLVGQLSAVSHRTLPIGFCGKTLAGNELDIQRSSILLTAAQDRENRRAAVKEEEAAATAAAAEPRSMLLTSTLLTIRSTTHATLPRRIFRLLINEKSLFTRTLARQVFQGVSSAACSIGSSTRRSTGEKKNTLAIHVRATLSPRLAVCREFHRFTVSFSFSSFRITFLIRHHRLLFAYGASIFCFLF